MDSSPANKRFAEDIGVQFPLLSDWKRKTAKDYGVYNEATGYGTRATFVIDTGAYQACSIFQKKKA